MDVAFSQNFGPFVRAPRGICIKTQSQSHRYYLTANMSFVHYEVLSNLECIRQCYQSNQSAQTPSNQDCAARKTNILILVLAD